MLVKCSARVLEPQRNDSNPFEPNRIPALGPRLHSDNHIYCFLAVARGPPLISRWAGEHADIL